MPKWLAGAFPVRDSVHMHQLHLHPDCEPGPVTAIKAGIEPTATGARATFRVEGDIHAIKVPDHANSVREDNLWKTTCFEVFWQPVGKSNYREFNLSPSSKWACYDFDDFRLNSRDAPVKAIALASAHCDNVLMLSADISSELPLPARIALNAIVEDAQGTLQFWALAFQDGRPEFHSATCRALALEDTREHAS